jgi:predicted permease
VSANYFRTFGVPVAQGRDFSLAEEGSGAEATVAVVSHGYWLRHGGRPDLLGSILRVNGNPVQVVGIAAAGFTGHTAVYSPEIWLPLGLLERVGNDFGNGGPRPRLEDRENRGWLALLIGRIDAHRSKAEAAADLETLAARLEAQHPPASGTHPTYVIGPLSRFGVSTGPEDDAGVVNLTVLLVGMSSILLLVACINLANMFLARGAGRRSEMAIRRALGGGRMRLVRQLLIEGSILALAGGAAGLFLAYWAARWLASSVAAVPAADLGASIAALDLRPDLFVLGATLAACVLATLLFGLGPAWRISGDVAAALNEHAGGPGAFATRRFRIARIPFAPRNLLIVLQVSLSLALLTAGGLFLRSAFEAGKAKPGFDIDPIALAEIDPSLLGYDEARSREIYRQALERVRAMPGVETASLASLVAYGGLSNGRTVQRRDSETPAKFSAQYVIIGDHYFDTLGLPMMRGRGFTRAEASFATAHPVAIVDEPLAKRLFGNAAGAVGRYVVLSSRVPAAEATAMEIVGVAPGLRNGFSEQPSPHVYVPFGQHYAPAMHLEVRAADTVDADSLLEAIRRELLAIDAAMPVLSMKTMTDQRDGSVAMTLMRAGGQVFAVLGGLALLLAVVGVYGVKAFLVARRTREIGLRMALGAGPGDVKRQILREGVGLTVAGLVIGLWLAVAVGRVLSGMLYGIDAVDPVVLAAVAALLATAALTAAYVPARRATRIDPMNALRHD